MKRRGEQFGSGRIDRTRAIQVSLEISEEERFFEHGLSKAQIAAVLDFRTSECETYGQVMNEGSHLTAVSIVLPGLVSRVSREFYQGPLMPYYTDVIGRSAQNLQNQDIRLATYLVLGTDEDVTAAQRDYIVAKVSPLLEARLSASRQMPSTGDFGMRALLLRAVGSEIPLSGVDYSRVYNRIVRGPRVGAYERALLLRLAEPDVDIVDRLAHLGFSFSDFQQEIYTQNKRLRDRLEESQSPKEYNADVYLLTQLLALEALLLAKSVRIENGRIDCEYAHKTMESRALPARALL